MSDSVTPDKESERMYADSGTNPAIHYAVVTPSNTVNLSPIARSLRVGIAGDLTVLNYRGDSVLFKNCYEGETIPGLVRRVMVTGTTADNIIAYYG